MAHDSFFATGLMAHDSFFATVDAYVSEEKPRQYYFAAAAVVVAFVCIYPLTSAYLGET